jgi:DDE superfamily endonuclease
VRREARQSQLLSSLAFVLAGLPVVVTGRVRSGRVFRFPAVRVYDPRGGRPPKHGREFALAKPESWPEPAHVTATATERYGTAAARAWDRLHPRLTHRTCQLEHHGKRPIIEGTARTARSRTRARRTRPEADLIVGVADRRGRLNRRPALAGLPPQIRPRTHLQTPERAVRESLTVSGLVAG